MPSRLDVDGTEGTEESGLIAGNKTKQPDPIGQFLETELGEAGRIGTFQVIKPYQREVGHDHVPRQIGIPQPGEIVARLPGRSVQVLSAGLVLDEQPPLPQHVDAARAIDRALERGDAAAVDAEHVQELIPEGLCLGTFRRHLAPRAREGLGSVPDLVQRKRHRIGWFLRLPTIARSPLLVCQHPVVDEAGQAIGVEVALQRVLIVVVA